MSSNQPIKRGVGVVAAAAALETLYLSAKGVGALLFGNEDEEEHEQPQFAPARK